MMDLGNYSVNLNITDGKIGALEIHTKLNEISKEKYSKIMVEVMLYLGSEGYFDTGLPKDLKIYTKSGEIIDKD